MKVEFQGKLAHIKFDSSSPLPAKARAMRRGAADVEAKPLRDAVYRVEMHGKTAPEIVAEVERLHEYHAAKSARIDDLVTLIGTVFVVGDATFIWGGLTLREQGTDVQLCLSISHEDGSNMEDSPFLFVYPSVEAVPANEDIEALVAARMTAVQDKQAAHAETIASVQALLNGGG